MISEALAIASVIGGVAIANARRRDSLRHLLIVCVMAGFVILAFLAITGALQDGSDLLSSLHGVVGHLMLPLVAFVGGIWLRTSFSVMRVRPRGTLARLVFLLFLCYLCMSNTFTGYLGPSRFDPEVFPDNALRFQILHEVAVPMLIGAMLAFRLLRLVLGHHADFDKHLAAAPDTEPANDDRLSTPPPRHRRWRRN
jgi:hypothetical protein